MGKSGWVRKGRVGKAEGGAGRNSRLGKGDRYKNGAGTKKCGLRLLEEHSACCQCVRWREARAKLGGTVMQW